MKLLFEVRGPIIVRNGKPTIDELHQTVKAALGKIVLFGEVVPYDIGTLMVNVQCVGEDVRAGRIPNPGDTLEGWVQAIVREFRANAGTVAAI